MELFNDVIYKTISNDNGNSFLICLSIDLSRLWASLNQNVFIESNTIYNIL